MPLNQKYNIYSNNHSTHKISTTDEMVHVIVKILLRKYVAIVIANNEYFDVC